MGIEKAIVKDSNNQTILTQDYTLDTNGTILSMTYTPTGYGGSTSGELSMAYDPCGNLALMTDTSGNPQVSYAYDQSTTGVSDVYNPNGVVNLFTTGAKQGNVTVPSFGDDWITLPIQRPGQLGTITGGIAVDVTATGTGLTVANPCGEVGTCGRGGDCDPKSCADMQDQEEERRRNGKDAPPSKDECGKISCCKKLYKRAIQTTNDLLLKAIKELDAAIQLLKGLPIPGDEKKGIINNLKQKCDDAASVLRLAEEVYSKFLTTYSTDIEYCKNKYGSSF